MKTKTHILIGLICTICVISNYSCKFSQQNKHTYVALNHKTNMMKKIKGVDYRLNSEIEIKNDISPDDDELLIENKITFQGLGNEIKKVITKSDFEKKIDFEKIDEFLIKEISFSMNDEKDEIYLEYLVTLDGQEQNLVLTLKKDNYDWILN